jgi:hypothetical protein
MATKIRLLDRFENRRKIAKSLKADSGGNSLMDSRQGREKAFWKEELVHTTGSFSDDGRPEH